MNPSGSVLNAIPIIRSSSEKNVDFWKKKKKGFTQIFPFANSGDVTLVAQS